jgi:hypothetical protein
MKGAPSLVSGIEELDDRDGSVLGPEDRRMGSYGHLLRRRCRGRLFLPGPLVEKRSREGNERGDERDEQVS